LSDGAGLRSGYYVGAVEHRRLVPRPHEFRYRVAWVYLDLDEGPRAFAGSRLFSHEGPGLFRFLRSDHLRDADGGVTGDLREAVRGRVEQALGRRPSGAVRVLTQLRALGYVFNPVSFYLCFEGEELDAVVAEITNTPWGERHAYVLDARRGPAGGPWRFDFDKQFHVSPFFDMDQRYRWSFSLRGEGPASIEVHMTNLESGEAVFHAGMRLERRALEPAGLRRIAARFLLQTWMVHAAIYWQAALLWWKRTPFFTHPDKRRPAIDGAADS
jgi:DUF1365 family protein